MNILANLRSAFARNQRRKVIALTAAAGIVAAVVGTATAVAPTASVPITHGGAVSIILADRTGGFHSNVFSVPAGKKFMLTDIIVGNSSTTPGSFKILTTPTTDCPDVDLTTLTARIMVPASNNVVIPLVSGIGIPAGRFVCFQNYETEFLQVTLRGYLFT